MSDEKQASEALVEELIHVYVEAEDATQRGESFVGNGIRAVLSHLARRGVEGLPSVEELVRFSDGLGSRETVQQAIRFAVERCKTAIVPILAARDAALAEARAEIERLKQVREVDRRLAEAQATAITDRAEAAEAHAGWSVAEIEAAVAPIMRERDATAASLRARAEAAEKARDAAKKEKHDAAAEAQRLVLQLEKEKLVLAERLAAAMALTEDDLLGAGLGPENKGIPGILALIRRRAGAEPGPDQDIATTVQEHAAGPMPPAPDELEYVRNLPIKGTTALDRATNAR